MTKKTKRSLLVASILLVSFVFFVSGGNAQTEVARPVPVVVDGKELFAIQGAIADITAEQRALNLAAEIDRLIDDPNFRPSQLSTNDRPDSSDIVYGDTVLVTVTPADVDAEGGAPASTVAQRWLGRIKAAIEAERYRKNFSEALDRVRLGTVKSNILYILGNPLSIRIGIGIVGLVLIIVIAYSIRRSIPRYFNESHKRYTVSKIAEFGSYFICLVFLSIVFSDTLGSLAVILGAATAGIAFALKELIVSITGWLAITFGDTYKVGDRVQISGVKGDVIDVGLVRTTLMELGEWVQGDLYTGRIVRVANGAIFAGPTYNYTRDLPFLWDEVVIKISSDSDAAAARAVIQKVVEEVVGDYVADAKSGWERLKQKYLVEDEKIDPLITMVINDNKFEITARYPVDFRQRRSVKDEIFTGITREFGKAHNVKLA